MKLQITLKRSPIACLQVQKDTVAALGLRKLGQTVMKEDNPCIRGQIFRVRHMLVVKEIYDAPTEGGFEKAALAKAVKADSVKNAPAPKAVPKKAVKADFFFFGQNIHTEFQGCHRGKKQRFHKICKRKIAVRQPDKKRAPLLNARKMFAAVVIV